MRLITCNLIVAMAISMVNAKELTDIFKEGKVSGEISLSSEVRNVGKEFGPTGRDRWYQNTAYALSSVGLEYTTGSYKGFSTTFGVKAYKVLWEDDKDSITLSGKGDASERVWETDGKPEVVLSNAYLAYDNKNIHIKAGRQFLYTEFILSHQDAITLYANPLKNTEVEFIWSKGETRIMDTEFQPRKETNDVNPSLGMYKLGVSYKFNEKFNTKVYGLHEPKDFDVYGGKVDFSNGKYGAMIHYAKSNHDNGMNDSDMLEIKAYTTFMGTTATLGYINLGANGWGDINKHGDTQNPFEEGDAIFEAADAELKYISLNKNISGVGLNAVYGITDYKLNGNDLQAKELLINASYNFTKNLRFVCGFTLVNEEESASRPDVTQFNFKTVYKF